MNIVLVLVFLLLFLIINYNDYSLLEIKDNVIVFMSILFGFNTTSLTIVLFSPHIKRLYAQNDAELRSNQFYRIVNLYRKTLFTNLITIIYFIFVDAIRDTCKGIMIDINYLFFNSSYIEYIINLFTFLLLFINILFFVKVIKLSINFSVFVIKNRN